MCYIFVLSSAHARRIVSIYINQVNPIQYILFFIFSACLQTIDNCDCVNCESETTICVECNGNYGPLTGQAYLLDVSKQICIRKILSMCAPIVFTLG